MADAEIYKVDTEGPGKGRKIQQAMGFHADVQERLHTEAELGAFRAEAALIQARSRPGYDVKGGHSFIQIEKGKMDWYVVLNDERGLNAAMTIEFGRASAERLVRTRDGRQITVYDSGMNGLFILHDALKVKRGGDSDVELGAKFDE